jgi:hypothetical protein
VVLEASTAPRRSTASSATSSWTRWPAGGRAGHRGQRAGSGGGAWLLDRARYRCPGLGHLWADQGYTGSVVQAVSRILRFTIQIVGGIKPKGGFIIQPFAWMYRCRRLTRQYKQTPLAQEAMVVISQLVLMLRRLDRMTEPPPMTELFDRL